MAGDHVWHGGSHLLDGLDRVTEVGDKDVGPR